MTPKLIKSYAAAADTLGKRIAAFAIAEGQVAAAASDTDKIFGVVDEYGAKAGSPLDVVECGEAAVEAGGDIDAGEFVTADAQGRAVVAAPGAGETVRCAGIATRDAVEGDIFDIIVLPVPLTG